MKKALLVLMALLVPFFSPATIFNDGSVVLKSPDISDSKLYDCTISTNTGNQFAYQIDESSCFSLVEAGYQTFADALNVQADERDAIVTVTFNSPYFDALMTWTHLKWAGTVDETEQPRSQALGGSFVSNEIIAVVKSCPPASDILYTFPYDIVDGQPNSCANPSQITLVDSCNINDSLNVQVTDSNACYTKPDGSSCSVSSVDVGGGNFVYMGSEGNCYVDVLPDVSGNPSLGNTPIDNNCVNNGGLLTCPEDPNNVCDSTGYNCQEGCGYVNDSFVCYDIDTDSDGLPDYNDPDIDGDGIPNGDDLDADGNGVDDPIYGGTGGGTGSSVTVDSSGVIAELKKLNKNYDLGTVKNLNSNGELDSLNTDYETKLNDFVSQDANSLGFIDNFDIANKSVLSVVPVGECKPYQIPVGKWFATFDTCDLANRLQPILTWVFYFLTAWHIFFLINKTLSEGI